jgi:hypothetical protein
LDPVIWLTGIGKAQLFVVNPVCDQNLRAGRGDVDGILDARKRFGDRAIAALQCPTVDVQNAAGGEGQLHGLRGRGGTDFIVAAAHFDLVGGGRQQVEEAADQHAGFDADELMPQTPLRLPALAVEQFSGLGQVRAADHHADRLNIGVDKDLCQRGVWICGVNGAG